MVAIKPTIGCYPDNSRGTGGTRSDVVAGLLCDHDCFPLSGSEKPLMDCADNHRYDFSDLGFCLYSSGPLEGTFGKHSAEFKAKEMMSHLHRSLATSQLRQRC